MNPTKAISDNSQEKGNTQYFVIQTITELNAHLDEFRRSGKSIGFVPTMGALHEGHLTLVEKARNENDVVVVSIFVNPTQFNNAEDLKNYPRTPEVDFKMLKDKAVDFVFYPSVDEIYDSEPKEIEVPALGQIAEVMEGFYRPGHFNGMVRVVRRLFDIVKPARAYFGEKDFQQLAIVRYVANKLKLGVNIVNCETVRESSGLAMSSRNLKLSPDGWKESAAIYSALLFVNENARQFSIAELKSKAIDKIESSGKLRVEYIEIADEVTLQPAVEWTQFEHMRCFAAVYSDNVRLIDNVKLF